MEWNTTCRRVHISEKTLQCLSGEFEVEPAYGEKREETLRSAGLKTYFIKSVLKPVSLSFVVVVVVVGRDAAADGVSFL